MKKYKIYVYHDDAAEQELLERYDHQGDCWSVDIKKTEVPGLSIFGYDTYGEFISMVKKHAVDQLNRTYGEIHTEESLEIIHEV